MSSRFYRRLKIIAINSSNHTTLNFKDKIIFFTELSLVIVNKTILNLLISLQKKAAVDF